jgi:zinc/manganese transport system substrate-binding protein
MTTPFTKSPFWKHSLPTFASVGLILTAAVGCGSSPAELNSSHSSTTPATKLTNSSTVIRAVGAENEYANVISQIGGPYVQVTAIMSNPNTDPHTFEASPQVANVISSAELIVQNGLGYDTFMSKLESASQNPARTVIDVQHLLDLPDSTPNPHLWYNPSTMPVVATAIENRLSQLQPAHKAYFQANLQRFLHSLQPWNAAITALKSQYPGAPVATTEPVADDMLNAAGLKNETPWTFQADVMNGTDPSPQTVEIQKKLFTEHRVKVFLYNQQVVDPLTNSLLLLAKQNNIPVVGVYETMPPNENYQTWMLREVQDVQAALQDHKSAETMNG